MEPNAVGFVLNAKLNDFNRFLNVGTPLASGDLVITTVQPSSAQLTNSSNNTFDLPM